MVINKKVLIFPCHIPHGEEFAKTVSALGVEVVRATSVAAEADSVIGQYHLPFVNESGFLPAFHALLEQEDIGYVYAAHDVVLDFLKKLRTQNNYGERFQLCNDYQHKAHHNYYHQAEKWAKQALRDITSEKYGKPVNPPLRTKQYANLNLGFHHIPGQSDGDKLLALASVFTLAVPGDIVEIGCFWGRSSYALAFLARHHGLGSVVSIDPWDLQPSSDQGEGTQLVNDAVKLIDWEQVFQGFLTSVASLDNINYIRDTSSAAAVKYQELRQSGVLRTAELGEICITGEIAVLHIDGNHKYEEVKKDIASWMPFMKSGGWILLDDYEWSFGDGPQRAGMELIADPRVAGSFVASDTLFVQLK
ncbi:class I SAM-dependent methyltransferase [Pantoea sp. BAV 3049]|uniref:class I SAM-dependent methyltransferase n=1 Tax=Pantoea sp. BAV 3049 TaxID=2654188 RepID=UPI00131BE9A0|nr:class I SAM-dependent methyltransferase [Pantoea sp. BAV 3049]